MSIAHPQPEWEGIRQMARSLFKASKDRGDLTKLDIEAWRTVWPDATPADFVNALALHSRAGHVWMPEAGELAPYLSTAKLDAPSFGEVIGVVDGARFLSRREAVERVTEQLGGTAAAWMCAEGVERLRGMELAGEYAGAQRRMLQQSYESFVAGQAERARQGRPLLVATPDGRTARSDLRRVEPLKAIEGGEAA